MSFKLIPGRVWSTPGNLWAPKTGPWGVWAWDTCLSVALSMAGALTFANREGFWEGWLESEKAVRRY